MRAGVSSGGTAAGGFVLVVDDDARICRSISALARSLGWDVATLQDAADLATPVSPDEHQPDLVILDLYMPGTDGIEAMRLIGQRHPSARVLLISGDHGEMFATAEKLGVVILKDRIIGRMEKPLDIDGLRRLLAGMTAGCTKGGRARTAQSD